MKPYTVYKCIPLFDLRSSLLIRSSQLLAMPPTERTYTMGKHEKQMGSIGAKAGKMLSREPIALYYSV